MEFISHVIPTKTRQKDEVLILPVGDIQWAGDKRQVALGMLKRHIQWGVDNNAYFLGMGDYIDFMSPSNRQRHRSAALYDTANQVIADKADELTQEIYQEALAPSKGRWLGLLEGHHFFETAGGTTDQTLAGLLGAKFLGTSAFIRLQFTRGSQDGSSSVLIWCHHGVGAGQTPAAVLNKLKNIAAGFEADIYLMGHLPKKVVEVTDRLTSVWPVNTNPYTVHRTKVFAGTGGFMKGWVPQGRQDGIPRGGYPEQGMMPPASLGGIALRVRPRWKSVGGREMWVPDISVEV